MTTVNPPRNIEITDEAIHILWQDGHQSIYPHRFLRLRCQCAHCIDEWTREPVLDPDKVAPDVKAVDHMMVGSYAVQFLWSDAHYTGIYTYEILRAACTCPQCDAQRA